MTEWEKDPKYDDYDFPIVSSTAQPGHPGHTTPMQDAQVHQLRLMLEAEGYKERLDTITLLRFLRARKFDVKLAAQMFKDSEAWRKAEDVDELTRTFDYKERAAIMAYYPQYYHKTDKDGRPIYIERLEKVDIPAMHKITTQERMLKNLVSEYEKLADPRLPACSRKSGKLHETCCTIMDLKGIGISIASSVYPYIKAASPISQNYYPERLGKLYVINAPWGFSGAFSMIKSFLDPITVEKIHVLGYDYQKELLKHIDAENLPAEVGGKCNCPGGCQFSDAGPWQDPKWAKPPKWAKDEKAAEPIENKPPPAGEVAGDAAAPQAESADAKVGAPAHA